MNEFNATREDIARIIRENAKGNWYVLRVDGYVFKIYRLWAQIMQNPAGNRDSGKMGHSSQKALVSEIQEFMA